MTPDRWRPTSYVSLSRLTPMPEAKTDREYSRRRVRQESLTYIRPPRPLHRSFGRQHSSKPAVRLLMVSRRFVEAVDPLFSGLLLLLELFGRQRKSLTLSLECPLWCGNLDGTGLPLPRSSLVARSARFRDDARVVQLVWACSSARRSPPNALCESPFPASVVNRRRLGMDACTLRSRWTPSIGKVPLLTQDG
jgi:hypothetical protein